LGRPSGDYNVTIISFEEGILKKRGALQQKRIILFYKCPITVSAGLSMLPALAKKDESSTVEPAPSLP